MVTFIRWTDGVRALVLKTLDGNIVQQHTFQTVPGEFLKVATVKGYGGFSLVELYSGGAVLYGVKFTCGWMNPVRAGEPLIRAGQLAAFERKLKAGRLGRSEGEPPKTDEEFNERSTTDGEGEDTGSSEHEHEEEFNIDQIEEFAVQPEAISPQIAFDIPSIDTGFDFVDDLASTLANFWNALSCSNPCVALNEEELHP